MKTIITALIAATLAALVATAGVSVAKSGNKKQAQGQQVERQHRGPGHGPGPGPIGPQTTYAEIHNYENGSASLVRLDQGQITAVSSDSLTLKGLDGSSVDVALSNTTKVMIKGNRSATVADLAVGQIVTTVRKDGASATTVMVRPAKPLGATRR